MKPYSLMVIPYLIVTIVTGILLLNQNQAAQPLQFQESTPTSSVQLTASRDRVLFPAQCVWVFWQLEGIREVYLNEHGKVGQGAEESCTVGKPPIFRVVFQDGHERTYTLPVAQLYNTPTGLMTLSLFVVGIMLLAGLLLGPRAMLMVLVLVVFGPLLRTQLNLGQDYIDHDMFAAVAMSDIRALPPHFLYHISAIVLVETHLVPNIENAGYVVMIVAYVATALAAYQLLVWLNRHQLPPFVSGYVWVIAILALMLLGPISLLSATPNSGQANAFLFANTYHNPTISLLKPLAVLLFLIILNMLQGSQGRMIWFAFMAAVLTVLCTLAKPNYTIAIVPAIALVIAYSFLRPFTLKRMWLGAAIFIPAAIVLIWQYGFVYGTEHSSLVRSDNAAIIFAPFDYYMTVRQISMGWLLLDLAASIAFPALVYLFNWRKARLNLALNLSWLVFFITLAQAYLFNERPDGSHGNLTWGTQISLFILFAVSIEYFVYNVAKAIRHHESVSWQLVVSGLVMAGHVTNKVALLIAGRA